MALVEDRPAHDDAFDDAPCALMRTDSDGLFLRVNATFCKWAGYERAELVKAKRLQDLFTIGGRIFHQTHWLPLLQMQGSVSEVKLEIVRSDRKAIPMVLNAIRRERDGVLVHDVAAYVAHDRDKYEKELLASRRKLLAAAQDARQAHERANDRALVAEQMMGVVSHDLRNPLSTISMGALLLNRLSPTEQQQAVLDRIGRATQRANHLISDLLDFTQARLGGGLNIHPRAFALHAAVRETVDELSLAFRGRELLHEARGANDSFGDPNRITQLVGNLVANAMTYGDPARPVTVTTSTSPDGSSVSVHNWGKPIPASLLPTLFEPMSRGESAGDKGSLGLGLYIVRQIAKAHGGEVLVTSDEESGTTFSARLPRGIQPPATGA